MEVCEGSTGRGHFSEAVDVSIQNGLVEEGAEVLACKRFGVGSPTDHFDILQPRYISQFGAGLYILHGLFSQPF